MVYITIKGKKYYWYKTYDTRKQATTAAKKLRAKGYKAQAKADFGTSNFCLWVHKK